MPSGIVNAKCKFVIRNGVVVNIPELFNEGLKNEEKGLMWWKDNLIISDRAHIVFSFHQQVDALLEASKANKKLGTTKKGIGPTYSSKAGRVGLRITELMGSFDIFAKRYRDLVALYKKQFFDLEVDIDGELEKYKTYREELRPMVHDATFYMHEAIHAQEKKNIIIEGANATMLDIDIGTYSFVTSSNCTVGGVCTGMGIPPSRSAKQLES